MPAALSFGSIVCQSSKCAHSAYAQPACGDRQELTYFWDSFATEKCNRGGERCERGGTKEIDRWRLPRRFVQRGPALTQGIERGLGAVGCSPLQQLLQPSNTGRDCPRTNILEVRAVTATVRSHYPHVNAEVSPVAVRPVAASTPRTVADSTCPVQHRAS